MAGTKRTARKATGAGTTVLPDVTHTPPVVEDGLLHTRCREECPLSQLLCRALREMGRRPCPFISVQTVHEEGNCMAQVVLPRGTFAGQQTLTTYGANEEEAYRKAVMGALTSLSSVWERTTRSCASSPHATSTTLGGSAVGGFGTERLSALGSVHGLCA
ncbi:hypothetical protein U9M48_042669 [Paspalum notatum var. saurae]|uniref:Uncharacterized protein n=1 Tax=Paspalum notatum var. saurae TaxID=547442 RepID=A0AAQ3UVT0_PASNO